MSDFPKWFEKDGVKKHFTEKPTEVGWEECSGRYDFARGVWVDDEPVKKEKKPKKFNMDDFDHGEDTHGDFIKAPVAAEGKEELKGLRALYKEATGKRPFNGWSADDLRAKLDALG